MIDKKIYKYTSIISFTIVIMLIANLVIPMFSIANDSSEATINEIQYNEENETLTLSGTIPSVYVNKNSLYWCKGEIPFEMPQGEFTVDEYTTYIDNVARWCTDNLYADIVTITTADFSNTIESDGAGKYNAVLILGESYEGGLYKISYTIGEKSSISINPTVNDKTINIAVTSTGSNVKTIKISKSDTQLTEDYFASNGEEISFNGTTEVSTNKVVDSSGTYYIYAENESGAKAIATATIQETVVTPREDTITIQKYKKNRESQTVYLRVESELGVITSMKYYISNENLQIEGNTENQDLIKNNGKDMPVESNKVETARITDTAVEDAKYMYLYVVSEYDENVTYSYFGPVGRLGDIESVDTVPWEPEQEEPEEEPSEQPEEEPSEEPEEEPSEQPEEEPSEQPEEEPSEQPEEEPGEQPEEEPSEQPEEESGEQLEEESEEQPSKNEETDKTQNSENKENIEEQIQDLDNDNIPEKTEEDLPQTGSDDSFIILAISIFLILGMASFVKYKQIK